MQSLCLCASCSCCRRARNLCEIARFAECFHQDASAPGTGTRVALLHHAMQPSMFNVRVPLEARDEVFLMNTLTDAQLVVSRDVVSLLDRFTGREPGRAIEGGAFDRAEREAVDLLFDNGFIVADRKADQRRLDKYFTAVKNDNSEGHVTVLTTLQCNFACDYCFQGDHGDYNKFADKMTLQTAEKVADWIENELARVRPG